MIKHPECLDHQQILDVVVHIDYECYYGQGSNYFHHNEHLVLNTLMLYIPILSHPSLQYIQRCVSIFTNIPCIQVFAQRIFKHFQSYYTYDVIRMAQCYLL